MVDVYIGIGVVIVVAAILAYSLYYVFRLEAEAPTEAIVPDEHR